MKPLFLSFLFMFLINVECKSQNADIDILHAINADSSASADKAFKFISNSVVPVSIATPVAMFVAGLATHDKELKKKSYVAGVSFIAATASTYVLKVIVKRPRPYETYPDLIVKKSDGGSYSFPSGHTSAAFATATSLSMAFPKWYVIVPSYTYACAAGYSRMYLGVHYPSDVLAGAIIGMASSYIVFKGEKWINKKRK